MLPSMIPRMRHDLSLAVVMGTWEGGSTNDANRSDSDDSAPGARHYMYVTNRSVQGGSINTDLLTPSTKATWTPHVNTADARVDSVLFSFGEPDEDSTLPFFRSTGMAQAG